MPPHARRAIPRCLGAPKMVRKKRVLCAHENDRDPRGPFWGARGVGTHTPEHPGAKKSPAGVSVIFMRAENLTSGPPSPEGSQNRRNKAPARGQLAFWCPRCLRGVVNGYIKSQKHLKATITSQNEQKRAKIVQNPSFRARAHRKSKIWHAK